MSLTADLEDLMYGHYLKAFSWIGSHEDAVSVASAMRNMHVIANLVGGWKIPPDLVPVSDWLNKISADVPHTEVELRASWVLDSSVGDLMRQVQSSYGFQDEPRQTPILPNNFEFARIPSPHLVVDKLLVTDEWRLFFEGLKEAFIAYDFVLRQLLTNVYDLKALIFHAYVRCSVLHQALSMLDYALSWEDVLQR